MFDVGTFCDVQLDWYDSSNISAVVCEPFLMPKFLHKQIINHTCKFGYLLNSYAELDGPKNEQIAFKVDIKDLKVNGKMIKYKIPKMTKETKTIDSVSDINQSTWSQTTI